VDFKGSIEGRITF